MAIKQKKDKSKSNKVSSNGLGLDTSLRFNSGWNYAPAPESTAQAQIKAKYDLFIGGKFVKPVKGKYFPTINPANEKKLADVALADSNDVDKAVKSARKAYVNVWSKMAGRD